MYSEKYIRTHRNTQRNTQSHTIAYNTAQYHTMPQNTWQWQRIPTFEEGNPIPPLLWLDSHCWGLCNIQSIISITHPSIVFCVCDKEERRTTKNTDLSFACYVFLSVCILMTVYFSYDTLDSPFIVDSQRMTDKETNQDKKYTETVTDLWHSVTDSER